MDPQQYPGQQQAPHASGMPPGYPGGPAVPQQPVPGAPMPPQPQYAPQQMPQAPMPPAPAPHMPVQGPMPHPQQPQPQPQPGQPAPGQPNPNAKTPPPVPARNLNSTQNTLLISEMRDSMVIMNDGSMRAVVACRSINFDLMSAREREGIEYGYQSFLNSLYFAVQILIRSQRVDIGPYLQKLARLRRDQDNMLLGVLMDDYIEFIATISEETNIMDKQFYVVIPYYPSGDLSSAVTSSKNLMAGLSANQKQQAVIHIAEPTYQKAKEEMQNRVMTVINGLIQMGIHSTRLDTKQLGELYYNVYNPDTAVREPLGNFDTAPTIAIRKGTGQAPQPHLEREKQ